MRFKSVRLFLIELQEAIFETAVDQSHPLAFGYDSNYFTLKLSELILKSSIAEQSLPLNPVEVLFQDLLGLTPKSLLQHSLVLGAERLGRGRLVYFVDNPVFRGFWYGAKQSAANALFFDF